MMNEDQLRDASVLIFANKQDLPNAITSSDLTDIMGLRFLKNRNWFLQASCAATGSGLYEGLDWLSRILTKKKH
jgi:signal recognition particle receptor subunit beta